MTKHELKLCKTALQALHEADGAQLNELALHGRMTEILQGETIKLGDFNATLATLDVRGWCNTQSQEFGSKLRKKNPKGEAALEDMQ